MSIRIAPHVRRQALPAVLEAAAVLTPILNKHPRTRQALAAVAVGKTCYAAFQAVRSKMARPPQDWTVAVKTSDDLYPAALTLIASQAEQNWQAVEAGLSYDDDLRITPSQRAARELVIAGHAIYASVGDVASPNGDREKSAPRISEVVFSAQSEAGQKAVLAALASVTERPRSSDGKKREKPSQLFTSQGWGWNRRGALPRRPVESVAVTDGQVAKIVEEIRTFLGLEEEYARRGVPFHRAFLLYGPPGTGKTSAAKAIAHALDRDLYAASLGSVSNDGALSELVENVGQRSILLLEDVDSFGAARGRSETVFDETGEDAGISTTGLLNALDGVDTPHGLVTILTTNHKEFLDEALLRPGRIDRHVFFGYPDDATVERHFAFFFGREPRMPLFANGRSGAEVNEVFVRHIFEPEAVEAAFSAPLLEVVA